MGPGWEDDLIKLDIINEVVNKTGITKTKAEMAVETVFESMKRALSQGERIELRGFGIFNVRPRKTGLFNLTFVFSFFHLSNFSFFREHSVPLN